MITRNPWPRNSAAPVWLTGWLLAVLCGIGLAIGPLPAKAQDTEAAALTPFGDSDGPAGADWRKSWRVTLGGGALYQPVYAGSDAAALSPLPYIGVTWRDRLTVGGKAGQGATLDLAAADPLEASLQFSYEGGRASSAADALDGMGDIDSGLGLGASVTASWFHGGIELAAEAKRVLAGSASGWRSELSLQLAAPVPGVDGLILGVRPSVSLADRAYRNARFGVDAGQAQASGYPTYQPGPGVMTYDLPLIALYSLGNWQAILVAGPARVSDGLADSPINRRRWNGQGLAALGYRFGAD